MASRVNKKFVVILTASLLGVFVVVAGAGYYALSTRAERNVTKGDEAYAAGNFVEAKKLYGRAVARDQTNIEWLEKFVDALLKSTPSTRAEYDKFYDDYEVTMARLARLRERDVEAQIEYVAFRDRVVRETGASTGGLRSIESVVDDATDYIREDDPKLPALRRYSALATVDRMFREVVENDIKREALQILEDAVEYNPDDHEAAIALAEYEFAEMTVHRRNRAADRARVAYADGMEALNAFLAENPGDPSAMLLKVRMEFQEGNRRAVSPAERARFFETIRPVFLETMGAFTAADPSEIPPVDLKTLVLLAGAVGESGNPELLPLIDASIEATGGDLNMQMLRGDVLLRMNEHAGAIEAYEKIVDEPLPPVSLRGRMLPFFKLEALAKMVDVSLAKYSLAQSEAEKDAAIDEARAFRDRLEEIAGVRGQDQLALRDAKLAIVDQDYQVAVSKLSEIIKSDIGERSQNHYLLAFALQQLGNDGEAKNVLTDLLEVTPNDPQLLTRIAELDINFGDYESALVNLERAIEYAPGNEGIERRLREVRTAIDPESADADPLVATVINSRKLRDESNFEQAEALVRGALEENPLEFRLVRELAEILTARGDREGALAVVDAALAEQPENTRLKQVRLVIEEDDPVELGLRLIDLSDASTIDKLIDKHQVYLRHGETAKSEEMLAKAREMDPLNSRVIDLDFLLAMQDGRRQDALDTVERATEANADQVEGRLYSARFELVFGDVRRAIEILEEVVEDSPRKPAAWLLLGEARLAGGRVNESVEAFEKAYEGRPNDPQLIKAYARALIRVNREAEALALLTPEPGVVRQTMADPEIVEMWLRLGESYGSREEIYDRRRDLFEAAPTVFSYRNAIDYFRMSIEDELWEEAVRVLDQLSSYEDFSDLQTVVLRVNLVEKRDGIEEGKAEFARYLAGLDRGSDDLLLAYLNYGDFLINRSFFDEGAEVYESAREFQTNVLEADRKLGDIYFNRGSRQNALADASATQGNQDDSATYRQRATEALEKAATYYTNIVDSSADQGPSLDPVIKRYAETLLKLGRVDDSKAAVARLDGVEEDLELLVLRASIAVAEGDRRGARDLYDVAVERFPDRTLPYIQRALFNAGTPELLPDAIADLQQAVVLDPGRVQAWVKLFDLRRAQGEFDEAFADLRRAIDANPGDDSLERLLISELFAAGRREEGLIAAQEAVRERSDNEQWISAVATIMSRFGRFRDAAQLYQRLIELDDGEEPNANYIAGLLDTSLRRTDTDVPDSAITNMLRSFRLVMDDESVYHLMLESRALTEIEQVDEAFDRLKDALAATGDNGTLGALWFSQLQLVTKQRENSYAFMQQVEARGELNPYLVIQLQNFKRNQGEEIQPLIDRIDRVLASEPDLLTTLEGLKVKSRFLYSVGEFGMSAEAILSALEITPDDAEMNNNLAYIYVEHLQDYNRAVEYAERALSRNARSSVTLDTLGWAYYHVDRLEDALRVLRSAVELAGSDAERIPAKIHLGFAELKDGNPSGARRQYEQALQMAESSPDAASQYEEKLEKLRAELQ